MASHQRYFWSPLHRSDGHSCQRSLRFPGRLLAFFSPFLLQAAARTNVFSQVLPPSDNAYVFPPFFLIGPLIKFLSAHCHCAFFLVVPDLCTCVIGGPFFGIASPLLFVWASKDKLIFCYFQHRHFGIYTPPFPMGPLGVSFFSSPSSFVLRVYLETSRLWIADERCPDCHYPNDQGFCFCQQCGFRKDERAVHETPKVDINIDAINGRLNSLRSTKAKKPYQKQRSSLQKELATVVHYQDERLQLCMTSPRAHCLYR